MTPLPGGGRVSGVSLAPETAQRLLKIWKGPEDTVRELVSNSVEGVRRAVSAGLVKERDALVRVELRDRVLTVSDNGIGISPPEFANLRRMGEPPSRDAFHHGIGFYSYVLAGTTAVLSSMTDDGESMVVKCTGAKTYKEPPRAERDRLARKSRGTTVTITLDPGVNRGRLERTAKTLSHLSAVPVQVDVDGWANHPTTASCRFEEVARSAGFWSRSQQHVSGDGWEALVYPTGHDSVLLYDRLKVNPRYYSAFRFIADITDTSRFPASPGKRVLTDPAEKLLHEELADAVRPIIREACSISCDAEFRASPYREWFLACVGLARDDQWPGLELEKHLDLEMADWLKKPLYRDACYVGINVQTENKSLHELLAGDWPLEYAPEAEKGDYPLGNAPVRGLVRGEYMRRDNAVYADAIAGAWGI